MESLDQVAETFPDEHSGNGANGRSICRKQLINLLNFANFKGQSLTASFRHRRFGTVLSLEVVPAPCVDETLRCTWLAPFQSADYQKSYTFDGLYLSDGVKLIKVAAEVLSVGESGLVVRLPESATETSSRGVRRYPCVDVAAEVLQNGALFRGALLDFSSLAFNVDLFATPPQSFNWINVREPVHVVMKRGEEVLFSGECEVLRQGSGATKRNYVFRPRSRRAPRFNPKTVRSNRYRLVPPPHVFFEHPLTRKVVRLSTEDLSGSGFSVLEHFEQSVLPAGLIIPELHVEITSAFTIKCRGQVVSTTTDRIGDEATQRCGIAFLDMDVQDQVKLANLLYQQHDAKISVCPTVDMDDLWRFFFEAGFIYPQKYLAISDRKQSIKETYEKLYMGHPEITRHIVYLDKGRIQGHISMMHAYENAWLFHHHAADKTMSRRAGLSVLYLMGQYMNDFYNLVSTHLQYAIIYYRPDNKFPRKMYGGTLDAIRDPKACSSDPFVFFHYRKGRGPGAAGAFAALRATLEPAAPGDLRELHAYYEHQRGGLLLDAFDLAPDSPRDSGLDHKYAKAGLQRKKLMYVLKRAGTPLAFFLVMVTDFGLNLSNLTNCIHAFVLDPDEMGADLFYGSLERLSGHFPSDEVTVLTLGTEFMERHGIQFEKIYNCWIISLPKAIDQYYLFTDTFLLRGHRR